MRNVFRKDVTGIVVLLLIFVIAGLCIFGNDTGGHRMVGFEDSANPSIYNDRGSGTRGFFEMTKNLGYHADVLRKSWSNIPPNASVLISAAPSVDAAGTLLGASTGTGSGSLDGNDADGVRSWLTAGHTLILMSDNLPAPRLKTTGTYSPGSPSSNFGDRFGLSISSALSDKKFESYMPVQPVAIVRGVDMIRMHGGYTVKRYTPDEIVLFGNPPKSTGKGPIDGEPGVVTFAVGAGRVIAIADGYFACNNNLARAENATFLSNILTAYAKPGDLVLFDEYHHGDIADEQSIWSALGSPIQNAIYQLILTAIVSIIVLSVRFGSPLKLESKTRRNTSEYVTSLAGLYRSAHAASPALEVIYRQFLRDVCGRLALPPDVSLETLADVAARRGQVNGVALKRLLSLCERGLDQQHVSETELLDLVRQMERFRKDLGID